MRLSVQRIGTGSQHVVFLHGLFGQGKNWTSIAQGIGDIATCHLVDLPNHGSSPWTETFSLDNQAAPVADWIAALPHPCALVGHSLGGKVAMRLALHRPELVTKLMVVDISPARNEAASMFAHLVTAMRGIDLDRLPSRTQAERELADAIPSLGVRRFLLQNLRHKGNAWFWTANLDLLGDSLHEIGGWPRIEAHYDGPVYWVVGGRSDYVLPEHLTIMRQLFPRVLQISLKRAGHWVHADDPEGFITLARHFLTEA